MVSLTNSRNISVVRKTICLVVDKDGNTTVTYSPKSFADAAGKATTTPAAGSENQK